MLIATRELTLLDGGNDIKIPIRIFAPEKGTNGNWFCRYEIDWPEKKIGTECWRDRFGSNSCSCFENNRR